MMNNNAGSRDKDTTSFRSLLERVDEDDVPTTRRRDALEALREARMRVAAAAPDTEKPNSSAQPSPTPFLSASEVMGYDKSGSETPPTQTSAFDQITKDISDRSTQNRHLTAQELVEELEKDDDVLTIDMMDGDAETAKQRLRKRTPLAIAAALGLCIGLPLLWLPAPDQPVSLADKGQEQTSGQYRLQSASVTGATTNKVSAKQEPKTKSPQKAQKTATINEQANVIEDGWLAVIPDQSLPKTGDTAASQKEAHKFARATSTGGSATSEVPFELAPEEASEGPVDSNQRPAANVDAKTAGHTDTIKASAGDRIPVPVKLDPMHAPAGVAALLISGLPNAYKVDGAIPTGDNNWLLLADVLSDARIVVPASAAGTLTVSVSFFDFGAKQIGRTTFNMTLRSSAATRQTSPDQAEKLAKQGLQKMKSGDIIAARLLLERAAESGHAGSAFALGEAFDPAILAARGIVGISGDRARARFWYQKAKSFGINEADARLAALSSKTN